MGIRLFRDAAFKKAPWPAPQSTKHGRGDGITRPPEWIEQHIPGGPGSDFGRLCAAVLLDECGGPLAVWLLAGVLSRPPRQVRHGIDHRQRWPGTAGQTYSSARTPRLSCRRRAASVAAGMRVPAAYLGRVMREQILPRIQIVPSGSATTSIPGLLRSAAAIRHCPSRCAETPTTLVPPRPHCSSPRQSSSARTASPVARPDHHGRAGTPFHVNGSHGTNTALSPSVRHAGGIRSGNPEGKA